MKTLKIFLTIGWISCSSLAFAGNNLPGDKDGNTSNIQFQKIDSNTQALMNQVQLETEKIEPVLTTSLTALVENKIQAMKTIDPKEKEPDKSEASR